MLANYKPTKQKFDGVWIVILFTIILFDGLKPKEPLIADDAAADGTQTENWLAYGGPTMSAVSIRFKMIPEIKNLSIKIRA